MKALITVTRVGDSIRISRVTAHGEEVIEADAEVRALGVLLWGKLSNEEPSGGTPLLPWDTIITRLDRLNAGIEKLTARIDNHAHTMAILEVRLEAAKKLTKPTPVIRGQ